MAEEFAGQCQCGEVKYRVTGTAADPFCLSLHGVSAPIGERIRIGAVAKRADIQLLSGALKEWVRTTPLGKRMTCRFCPTCGTRVFHQMLGQSAIMSIKPGTLNDTKGLEPVAHIWTASKQSWLEIPAGTLQFQEGPASFEGIFCAWAQAHA